MSDGFDRNRGPRGRPPQGARSRPGARPFFDEDLDDEGQDEARGREDEGARRRPPAGRPRPRPGGGRAPQQRSRSSWSLFGPKRAAGGRARRDERFDWGAAEDEDYDEAESYDREGRREVEEEEYEAAPRRRPGPARRPQRRVRATLMDLCTPVFGFAAILPREAGGIHPGYQQFRQEIRNALQRVESEAPDHGIDREDAREACYALSLFLDEQVAESEWSGKAQWSAEPLSMVLLNDPEGGVNFFAHLERLGDRQRAVKKVYLVCLALGYRGKYAELDPSQQAARIGEIRQKLLRSIQDSLDGQDVLFPEGYEPAVPMEGQAPPPPRWWLVASFGTVAVTLFLYLVLFWVAGTRPDPAKEKLRNLAHETSRPAEPEPDRGTGSGGEEGGS